jgi:hypothetical protein
MIKRRRHGNPSSEKSTLKGRKNFKWTFIGGGG